MIPILYEKDESNFTSNGLGRLADAVECIVKEERNGAYELYMRYPVDGIHFSDITIDRFIYAEPSDGKDPQPFRIYHISKPLGGVVEVNAEHVSYQMAHIPVSPFEASAVGSALLELKNNAAEPCPFTFWTDKSTLANFKVERPSSIRSLLGGQQGSILDVYGGEYEFDMYTVKLHNARGSDRGASLRYGKNITDIKQEENISNTYTGVYPFWFGTDDAGTEVLVTLTEKVLHSANAANFPYQRTIPLDMSSSFESQPTEAQLRSAAQSYMTANNIGVPEVSIDISFIPLWQTEEYKDIANLERVYLCDTVTVEFPMLGISATAKVVKTEYDVLKGRYKSIEVGEAKSSFAKTVKSDIVSSTSSVTKDLPTKTFLQKSVDRATRLITGGLGGHVVMNLNADGEPQEILIMDTDDTQTAVNVIRINQNGIGFSRTGYAGPFVSAWTIDGHFVADFIDTGSLSAALITTGTMQADRILGGILKLGGRSNGNGTIQLFDSNNNLLFTLDNNGLLYKSNQSMNVPITQAFNRAYGSGLADQSIYIGIHGIQSFSPDFYDGSSNMGQRGVALVNGEIRFFDRNSNMFRVQGEPSVKRIKVPRFTIYGDTSNTSAIDADGGAIIRGDLSVTGDKNRLIQTEDYGLRKQSAYEMCSPMFGDIGSGIIGEDGLCYIPIDPVFAQTVALDNYYVFVQSYDGTPVSIQERSPSYFVVHGNPNTEFVWEIKARQIDGSNKRNEIHIEGSPEGLGFDFGDMATNYISQLKEGRLVA